jgi:murein hydrolase activator
MFQKILNLKFPLITTALIETLYPHRINKGLFIKHLSILRRLTLLSGWLFMCLFCFITPVKAQSKRNDLEVKRQQLLKQIEQTSKQLNQIQQTREAARDRLEALQNQIENREALINNLREEISESDDIIERTEDVLNSLNEDIQRLRVEYAQMASKAYKMKVPDNALFFMLSSNSFSDAYKRWQYFRMYDKFRKRQAKLITETQRSLLSKNEALLQQKKLKIELVASNEHQTKMWSFEKENKDKLINELKSDERRVSGELKSQEKQSLKINTAIERLIAAELETKRRAAEERARKTREEVNRLARERAKENINKPKQANEETEIVAKPRREDVITESSEVLALSSDFRSNKGKLPPPATGTIVRTFGKQQVLSRVTAVNNGIDIKTSANADVRAVFSGNVAIISSIPGLGYVVLVQHGNYYTVYSNLSSVAVKKGQAVTTRQTLGYAGVNPVSNDSEVHFEVWLEKTHLNPSLWISR